MKFRIRNHINRVLAAIVTIAAGLGFASALPPTAPPEDFVRASVVIAGPGETLYSCAGHAFFRMQCPSAKMDYCFTYESEDVSSKVLTFLRGKLKMGMAAAPTDDFIEQYRNEGRGVTEYPLNLPIGVKQELWHVLDNYVDQGMELPYDFMERGCAISVLHILEEALRLENMETISWPSEFEKTRREILASELDHAPWTRVAINILTNGSANKEVPYKEKAVTPTALIELLQKSQFKGQPVISSSPRVLVKESRHLSAGWFSPMIAAIILLVITVVSCLFGRGIMLRVLIGFQFILGLANVYLVFFSSLCATEWSWLLIPFNPLPLIFWKWRSKWEIPYAIVIFVWSAVMIFSPHSLTDPSLIVVALSTGIAYTADRLVPEGFLSSPTSSDRHGRFNLFLSKLKLS